MDFFFPESWSFFQESSSIVITIYCLLLSGGWAIVTLSGLLCPCFKGVMDITLSFCTVILSSIIVYLTSVQIFGSVGFVHAVGMIAMIYFCHMVSSQLISRLFAGVICFKKIQQNSEAIMTNIIVFITVLLVVILLFIYMVQPEQGKKFKQIKKQERQNEQDSDLQVYIVRSKKSNKVRCF